MSAWSGPSPDERAEWEEQNGHRAGYRSPLLDRPGAVPGLGVDSHVPAHYGDPLGEQRTMLTDVGFVDRSHLAMLLVTGDDRLTWLDGLVSQRVGDLPDGRLVESLVLAPDGYIEFYVIVTNVDGMTLVSADAGGRGDLLLDFLRSHRSVFDVDVHMISPEWQAVSVLGPHSVDALGDVGVAVPPDPCSAGSLAGGGIVRRRPVWGIDMVDLIVPVPLLSQVVDRFASNARLIGFDAFEAQRVWARRPRIRFEVGPQTLPQEVTWMDVAVSLDKGPYRGRDALERVERPPRRMVLLRLEDPAAALPHSHAPVTLADREVGFVGTAVRRVDEGPLASAMVAADVPDDARLSVAGMPASVTPPPA